MEIHEAAVGRRQPVPIKALEMDVVHRLLDELGERTADGNATLGGCKLALGNGDVSCHRKGGRTNRESEEFGLRMQQETGCLIADLGGYSRHHPGDLAGLNGAPAAHGTTARETGT